jgi:prepilin-type N-terminal cleavage/methylation domain-containing protein
METATHTRQNGFTLIELVIVIVIFGILAAVAFRSGKQIYDNARVEQTRQEMDALTFAIAGNPNLRSNGARVDFGYIGDVGALPPDLDALHANPAGLATWRGPYIENRFTQVADDYKTDAWNAPYAFDGITITSTGSGSPITRRIAASTDELLHNVVTGNVLDIDGTPPGPAYSDSISVRLTLPDGTGGIQTRITTTDDGGYFTFDFVAIGNHPLQIVYLPGPDTVVGYASVTPGSRVYSTYVLPVDLWTAGSSGGSLIKIAGSDSLAADCNGFFFWIENTTGVDITIDWIRLSWTAPVAYYRYVVWNDTTVFDNNNPAAGSGDLANFTSSRVIPAGQSAKIRFEVFRDFPTGGALVDVEYSAFAVELSDGTSFEVTTGGCP